MIVPLKRSEGWWQPIIAGCGAPSGSRPSTWKVAIGVGQCLVGDVVDPGEGRRGRPELGHVLVGDHHDARGPSAAAGIGRQVWVGCGKAGEVLTPEIAFGFDMSAMSRM